MIYLGLVLEKGRRMAPAKDPEWDLEMALKQELEKALEKGLKRALEKEPKTVQDSVLE